MTTSQRLAGVRILVTGGSGFLGQHLVRSLIPLEAEVAILMRDPEASPWARIQGSEAEGAGRITVLRGDLLDEDAVVRAAAGARIVFHLAGRGGGGGSFRAFADANVTGTCNIVAACQAHSVARLVFVSTAAVYGADAQTPLDETHPLRGRSIYAASKIAAEALVSAYVATGAWAVTIRPSNIYGPDQMTDTVVTTILRQLNIADEIALRALHPIRDYIYVQDVVDALLAAALHSNLPPGRTLNISSGIGYSVQQLAEAAIAAVRRTKPERTIKIQPVADESEGRPDHLVCDNAAARTALDWTPRTDLIDGLAASYAAQSRRG